MSDRSVDPPYNLNRFPHFEQPFPSSQFLDVMLEVSGKDRAEKHLITIAQEEFLSCWLSDESTITRFKQWSASIGLPEITQEIANFLDRVAERYGLSRRAELGHTPRPPQMPVEDFLPEWYRLQDQLYAAYHRVPEVGDAIGRYVRDELRQPWPWLMCRLIYRLFQQAWEDAMGITPVYQWSLHLDDFIWGPYAQPSEYTLKTNDAEPLEVNKKRLMAEALAFIANLQPKESESWNLPKGKVRPDREVKTRRNTRWLYHSLIPKRELGDLAQVFHTERQKAEKHRVAYRSCSCLPTVKYGVKQAQQLLNKTPHWF